MATETDVREALRFRKKPVVIEAWRIGSLDVPRPDWLLSSPNVYGSGNEYIEVKTLEGTMRGDRGDWIIRGVKGELYPCKHDIFEATYEPAREALSASPGPVGKPESERSVFEQARDTLTPLAAIAELAASPSPAPTQASPEASEDLLPCPFCGEKAEELELTDKENFGGSVIICTVCGASSPVHFDRKEHLESSWNERVGEWQLFRARALEEAANVADAEARHYNSERIKANEHSSYATEDARISFHAKRDEAKNIAALIRALAKEPGNGN